MFPNRMDVRRRPDQVRSGAMNRQGERKQAAKQSLWAERTSAHFRLGGITRMAQSHTIKTSCASALMIFTLLGVAATIPPPKKSQALAISVHDINRDSVRVFAPSDKPGA